MKKLLSLLLAMLMLLSCAAMAETTVEMKKMTSPDGTYSFEVPQDFFSMDASVLKTIFTTEEFQQMLAQALGLADASQLAVYFEAMQEANMMIVYGSDMVSNLNVQVTAATLNMDMLVLLKDMMDNSMSQQYQGMGIAAEDIHPMDIQQFGGRSWYGTQLVMMGMDVYSMLTIENGIQYVVTFTGLDETVMQNLLESFTIGAPAASVPVGVNTNTETIGQRNALRSAKSYLEYSAFSRKGLIKQLEYEKYSNADAVYAVDHCGADWYEQAVECAKDYLAYTAFSYSGLVKQLEYEGFTHDEAVYGTDSCGADWFEQAVKCAKSYLEYSSFSRQGLIDQLEYEGFTNAQAVYGVTGAGY